MCRIMVMNLGSTSFKFKIYEMGETEACIASGSVESIGSRGRCTVETGEKKKQRECACATHLEAAEVCFASLKELGLELDFAGLDAVGYKAVHGGSISGARIVDGEVLAEMRRMCSLAPAHNPVYLKMMETMGSLHPELRQIACFETAFHATVPPERYLYGVPLEWVERYGIRRYGFHGSSHSYIAWKMAQESPGARRLISIHLGGSCSLCAIREGKSIANSMGATPQSGIFHNNRVGDLDVFCLPMLADQLGGTETGGGERAEGTVRRQQRHAGRGTGSGGGQPPGVPGPGDFCRRDRGVCGHVHRLPGRAGRHLLHGRHRGK